MISAINRNLFLILGLLLLPSLAHANVGVGSTNGFHHGFIHPLAGLDHLCAMIAVGLWAAQMGGRAIWAVPATFVGIMALGGTFAMMGMNFPFIEQGIILSVLALGVLIAASARLPLTLSIIIVGLFAICHGHAHGAEMPANASGITYGVGFILATALLHIVGIGVGIGIQRAAKPQLVRFAGVTIAACGLALFFI